VRQSSKDSIKLYGMIQPSLGEPADQRGFSTAEEAAVLLLGSAMSAFIGYQQHGIVFPRRYYVQSHNKHFKFITVLL